MTIKKSKLALKMFKYYVVLKFSKCGTGDTGGRVLSATFDQVKGCDSKLNMHRLSENTVVHCSGARFDLPSAMFDFVLRISSKWITTASSATLVERNI